MIGQIILWVLLILAALSIVLFLIPVGIRVRYQKDVLKIWYSIGPVRILSYPKNDADRAGRSDSKLSIRTVLNDPIKANRRYDNVIGDFWAELKTTLELFWSLRPKLRIKRLELKLHLAGDDPAALALQYGGAWVAIGALLPLLEEAFVLNKRQLDVDCSFHGDNTTLDAKLDISIGMGRLLWCLMRYSIDVLNRKKQITQKGGN